MTFHRHHQHNSSLHLARSRRRRAGMAFASTMLVLLGIMAVLLIGTSVTGGNGLMSEVSNGLLSATNRSQNATALANADSGVELTMQWLHNQAVPPGSLVPFAPAIWGGTTSGSPARTVFNYPTPTDSTQGFSILIYPDMGNAGTGAPHFLIESVGRCNGTTAVVQAYVQQISLGHYTYLSNTSSPTSFWASGVSTFDGAVHCNNADGAPSSVVWKSGANPIFLDTDPDAFTVSGNSIRWCSGSPNLLNAPVTTNDWNTVAINGHSSVHSAYPVIPLPTNSDAQQAAALGGTTAPTATGVSIPNTASVTIGGIYIHGDINQITFGTLLDALGHNTTQQISFQQPGLLGLLLTTVITINPSTNTTTLTSLQNTPTIPSLFTKTYTGVTNGVIYCDGNIGTQNSLTLLHTGGIAGIVADNYVVAGKITHANSWTVAVDETKSICVDGNFVYQTARQTSGGRPIDESLDSNFTLNAGKLGLIAGNVEIATQSLLNISILSIPILNLSLPSMEVDGSILAFNTCEADPGPLFQGVFTNMGNFIVGHDGSFGVINSSGSLASGFATVRYYDSRLSTSLPPYFPYATNQYDILSWRRAGSTLM